jgi:hypothetical protein
MGPLSAAHDRLHRGRRAESHVAVARTIHRQRDASIDRHHVAPALGHASAGYDRRANGSGPP